MLVQHEWMFQVMLNAESVTPLFDIFMKNSTIKCELYWLNSK